MSSTSSPTASDAGLRSVHTSNLPALFGQLQVSLVVSTYQAGKVILIRNDEGVLNTHFRTFGKPMGIAGDRARLTIGGTNTVWYYRNLPAVAGKLEPPGKYDACYLPRRVHVTGDIDIHELCWDAKDELWVVNTRFGCLCTLDGDHSYLDIATLQRRKTPSILPAGTRAKIGIVWAGSPTYQNDRHRSIALSELLPILRLPDFDFYSLQKGERCRDLLGLPPDCRVQDLDPSLADFGDTALVIGALDLVITVDTAVAHLVGALAKPVWTLLPEVPDWRWGLTDSTTPWYPSMRLFRQDRRGDWAGVIGRVSEALLKDARVMVTGDR